MTAAPVRTLLVDEAGLIHEALRSLLARAARGSVVLDPRLGRRRIPPPALQAMTLETLSPREREVLAELVHGLDNRGIAARLCISEETVKSHVKAILRKLDADSRAQAMAMLLGTHLPQVPLGAKRAATLTRQ